MNWVVWLILPLFCLIIITAPVFILKVHFQLKQLLLYFLQYFTHECKILDFLYLSKCQFWKKNQNVEKLSFLFCSYDLLHDQTRCLANKLDWFQTDSCYRNAESRSLDVRKSRRDSFESVSGGLLWKLFCQQPQRRNMERRRENRGAQPKVKNGRELFQGLARFLCLPKLASVFINISGLMDDLEYFSLLA